MRYHYQTRNRVELVVLLLPFSSGLSWSRTSGFLTQSSVSCTSRRTWCQFGETWCFLHSFLERFQWHLKQINKLVIIVKGKKNCATNASTTPPHDQAEQDLHCYLLKSRWSFSVYPSGASRKLFARWSRTGPLCPIDAPSYGASSSSFHPPEPLKTWRTLSTSEQKTGPAQPGVDPCPSGFPSIPFRLLLESSDKKKFQCYKSWGRVKAKTQDFLNALRLGGKLFRTYAPRRQKRKIHWATAAQAGIKNAISITYLAVMDCLAVDDVRQVFIEHVQGFEIIEWKLNAIQSLLFVDLSFGRRWHSLFNQILNTFMQSTCNEKVWKLNEKMIFGKNDGSEKWN